MKKLLLSAGLMLFSVSGLFAQGQIPNGSFETGASDSATGWKKLSGFVERISSQDFTSGGQTQTQHAVDGTYFMRLTTKDTVVRDQQDTTKMDTLAAVGTMGMAFPYTDMPKYIEFNAMYLPTAKTDRFQLAIITTKYDAAAGKSNVLLNYVISSVAGSVMYPWTKLSAAIDYGTNTTAPDSMIILISSASSNQASYGLGTTLWIDRIVFRNTNPASVVQLTPDNDIANMSTYPNPASYTSTIDYKLTNASQVNIRIFDMTGRIVADMPQGKQVAGEHQFQFDASTLKPGVYFYQLQSGSYTKTQRVIISR